MVQGIFSDPLGRRWFKECSRIYLEEDGLRNVLESTWKKMV